MNSILEVELHVVETTTLSTSVARLRIYTLNSCYTKRRTFEFVQLVKLFLRSTSAPIEEMRSLNYALFCAARFATVESSALMHIAASKCEEIVSLREIRDQTAMTEHCDLQRLRVRRQGSSMRTIDIRHAEHLLKTRGIDNAAVVAGNTASDRKALSARADTGESDR